MITTGQVIRRIRAKNILPGYVFYGGDPFLEECIINELKNVFLNGKGTKVHFSMDQDTLEDLLGELSSISLFEEKKIIVAREIKRIRSERGREELLKYLGSPSSNNVLVIISEEYDMKNSFLKQISNIIESIDLRTPFEGEMKKWASYHLKNNNIKITDATLNQYIQLYGDSIAHVINEIEKTSQMLGPGEKITEEAIFQLEGYDRLFHLWNLQDSLGKKNLKLSLEVLNSLLINGNKITLILMNLVFLYQQMLWKKMGYNHISGFRGINKIVSSRLKLYNKNYSYSELIELFQDLRKIDVLSKSISINKKLLLEPFLIKICKGRYV